MNVKDARLSFIGLGYNQDGTVNRVTGNFAFAQNPALNSVQIVLELTKADPDWNVVMHDLRKELERQFG